MWNTLLAAALVAGSVGGTPGADGVGDPYFPQDGNGGYRAEHYEVKVVFDPATADFLSGDTTITARATQNLDRFNLDLEGFTVTGVTVNGVPAAKVDREGQHELVVTPRHRIPSNGAMVVRVRYEGKPVGESWHKLHSGGVSVSGEPHSATAWYPVNDHPSDKATFALTATVPSAWTVIGNGLPGPVTEHDGHRTYRWHEDHPMASYLSTMAADKFTVHNSTLPDGKPVINAYGQGTTIDPVAEQRIPEIIQFLSSRFGPYPFESTGSIVVDARSSGSLALETQTRPTYEGQFFDASAVHELAHQWFGDNVSFSDWRDGCLAECFAQYAGQLWEEHKGADLDRSYRSIVDSHRDDPAYWQVTLYDPGKDRPLDYALYDRGSLMLHALRRTVGDEKFFGTLQAFQQHFRDGNASWPQFEQFMAQRSGQDLTGFFQAWAHSSTMPAKQYLCPGSLNC
ncbi:M1 family metallopeptidase [Kutzneria albida]|uniref:Aminopeptidase N n=1 Tax=Kutzneria albida DSM 43870 TaxID=1449976 RepID=W5W548_9PSEU|nr:M1 family metallopeptidase [Kutzneria albida]AHH96017.1 putative metallopeptidase [Kutzneria albida DSM 43870]